VKKARVMNGIVEIIIGTRRDSKPIMNTNPIKNSKHPIPVFNKNVVGVFCNNGGDKQKQNFDFIIHDSNEL